MQLLATSSFQNEFIIDERCAAIGVAASLGESAACVKIPGTGLGVVGIQADGVGRPGPGNSFGFLDALFAEAVALVGGSDGHGQEIERIAGGGKMACVNRPRFFGGESKRA